MSEDTIGAQTSKIIYVEDLYYNDTIVSNYVLIPPDDIRKSCHIVFKKKLAKSIEVECKN